MTYTAAIAQPNLERLRIAYPIASQDAEACKKELDALDAKKTTGIELAYHGAYYMVYAKHLSSPLSKLNTFKKGKSLMDEAIRQTNKNEEVHFLRLTIQTHAPSILGYDTDIKQDLHIILSKWDAIPEGNLKKNIKDFLSQNKNLLTEEQVQLIKT